MATLNVELTKATGWRSTDGARVVRKHPRTDGMGEVAVAFPQAKINETRGLQVARVGPGEEGVS